MRGHQPANGWELGLDDTVPPSRRVHAHTHTQAKQTHKAAPQHKHPAAAHKQNTITHERRTGSLK